MTGDGAPELTQMNTPLRYGGEMKISKRKITAAAFIVMIAMACFQNTAAYNVFAKTVAGGNSLPEIFTYENVIAITFDDGPRRRTTTKLLDGLKERDVKATFFIMGKSIEGNEDIIQRMYDEGHLIGNHTFDHVELTKLSDTKAVEEIEKTNSAISSITGYKPEYIRPPFGKISNKVEEAINMQCVMWSIDPVDWNTSNCSKVVNHVVNNAKNGDIILMHDIYDSSVTAALEIIDRLKAKGYVFVTVDQLLID